MNGRKGVLFILLAALLWSSGGIGIKAVDASPLAISMWRSAFASVTLFLVRRPRFHFTLGFLLSIASYAACLLCFVTATKWTTAANAIFLQYSGVIWVMLFSPALLGEQRTRRDIIAIAVSLAGMALFFVGRFELSGVRGNLMALLSGVFFAALILSLRRQREEGADEASVSYGNLLLAIVLTPFVARSGELRLDTRSFLILAALGVLQIALAYFFFVRGLRHVTATHASLTGMIEPVANPLWVFLFLGERPGAFAVLGGCIVLAAVAWRTVEQAPVTSSPPLD